MAHRMTVPKRRDGNHAVRQHLAPNSRKATVKPKGRSNLAKARCAYVHGLGQADRIMYRLECTVLGSFAHAALSISGINSSSPCSAISENCRSSVRFFSRRRILSSRTGRVRTRLLARVAAVREHPARVRPFSVQKRAQHGHDRTRL